MKKYKSPFLVVLFCLVTAFAMAQKPKATIVSPVNKSFYLGNQEITFKGTGFDSKDGNLAASSFRWLIFMNHGKGVAQHWHDGIGLYDGISEGTFTTPLSDDHVIGDSIFFRFYLIVKNSAGISDTAFVDVIPKQSKLSIITEPAGLKVNVQGNGNLLTPIIAYPTQNMLVQISALKNQIVNGITYTFKEWKDKGKNSSIAVIIGENETILTAVYTTVNAVNKKLANANIKIYPNPVQDMLTIEHDIISTKINDLQIINTDGKNINSFSNFSLNSNPLIISTSTLPNGLYILKVNTDEGYILHPFSKQ